MKALLAPWLLAARLRTLPLSLAGIVLGNGYALASHRFDGIIFGLACCTTIAFQVLSNFANDYGDGIKGTDNDHRIGPDRALQKGLISANAMRRAIQINAFVALVFSALLIGYTFSSHQWLEISFFLFLGIASIVAAIKYTVGSNAYGYYSLGDAFVFLFFGGISVIGSYYLQTQDFPSFIVLPAIAVGALSTAVLNLNNMRDVDNDRAMTKMTLAVRLGLRRAKYYHLFLIGIAAIAAIVYVVLKQPFFSGGLFLAAFIPLVFHLKRVFNVTSPKDFDPELKFVALTTFGLSIFWSLNLYFMA